MAELPTYPGLPRWVKVSGIISGVLIALAVIVMITGLGGPHGPARHLSTAGDVGVQTAPKDPVR